MVSRMLGKKGSEVPRYFQQRYDIFSKYDDGIWLTDDAWFGVTPEPVAEYYIPDV